MLQLYINYILTIFFKLTVLGSSSVTKCVSRKTIIAETSISPDVELVAHRLRWSWRPITSQPPYMSLRIHGGKHTDRQVLGKSNRAGGGDDV